MRVRLGIAALALAAVAAAVTPAAGFDVTRIVARTAIAPLAEPAAVGPAVASTPPTITVTAVGDLLFDSAPKRLIQRDGGKAPFARVAAHLRDADVTVGNLECPLSTRGAPVPGKTFTFQGDPRATEGLVYAGFDLLALGNNHARDYGGTALSDTFQHLNAARIPFAGAGADRTRAWRPAIIERGGARIAFLSFSQITPSSFRATDDRSGTAYTMDTDAVVRAVRSAGKTADYVIVSFHWGVEKTFSPTARQVRDGRAVIDAGADLVLSHHPHRIQGVEYYRGRLIAYSLGNFVFSPGSEGGRDTMILHATLGPRGVSSAYAEPVYIGDYGRPSIASGLNAQRVLGIIRKTSRERGTTAKVAGNRVILLPD